MTTDSQSRERPDGEPEGTTHFGYRDVPEAEKPQLVRALFSRVSERYDLMNDLMSGGVHRLWKRTMVDWLAPRPGIRLLDVAGGTGDIARRVAERVAQRGGGPEADSRIVICDLTPDMLTLGRDRLIDRGHLPGDPAMPIAWVCGDAEALPIAERSMDAYCIAFGLRNVTHIEQALAEARRVLRPGGRFLCLEFSRVVLPLLDRLYELYSFQALPAMGALVAGDPGAYRYLAESIRRFPPQDELAAMLAGAGLSQVRYRNLSGGIAAIHSAWRL